jgi:3-dehydroquinate dehydratase-2
MERKPSMKILVINGPNLNLLGTREPSIYGKQTLAEIEAQMIRHGREHNIQVDTFQSNHEGDLIDQIQQAAASGYAAIVLNPGAYAHTSLAIADAVRSVKTPVVEVHVTNIHARGAERAHSVTAAACQGLISGFGAACYLLGLDAAARLAKPSRRSPVHTSRKASPRRGPRKRS